VHGFETHVLELHENRLGGDWTYAVVPASALVHFGSAAKFATVSAIEYTSFDGPAGAVVDVDGCC
jgi:hypothetical protein